jgi:Asp-tRNA(Asn)/Glu-tRNA(Gln) amidotransferase A subunit family amidase
LFFGVPVSIKDHICEAGESLAGGSTWMAAHYVAAKDAAVVEMLKS